MKWITSAHPGPHWTLPVYTKEWFTQSALLMRGDKRSQASVAHDPIHSLWNVPSEPVSVRFPFLVPEFPVRAQPSCCHLPRSFSFSPSSVYFLNCGVCLGRLHRSVDSDNLPPSWGQENRWNPFFRHSHWPGNQSTDALTPVKTPAEPRLHISCVLILSHFSECLWDQPQ